ncbi:MAG TPA: hypothetical protein VKG85_06200 [Actinomycetes bacterium]|nr:hypothetical protein [Actinomycetes bacterium]
MIGNPLAEPEDRLAWEIRAVAERLRRLSPARLRAPLPPYRSREQAGRTLAQQLADAAAGVVARDCDQPPQWSEVPEIELFAVGEQVAVTGNDLVLELASLLATGGAPAGEAGAGEVPGRVPGGGAEVGSGAGEGAGRMPGGGAEVGSGAGEASGPLPRDIVIWTRTGQRPLSAVIDELLTTLRELRLGL